MKIKDKKSLMILEDACELETRRSYSIKELYNAEKCLIELNDCNTLNELKEIVASLSLENPLSDVLFLGKYKVFILEDLIPWQKNIGDCFQFSIAICAAQNKKFITEEHTCNEVFNDDLGDPLLIKFENIIRQDSVEKKSLSILKQLDLLYDLYPLPYSLSRRLLFLCSKIENSLKFPFITISHDESAKSTFLHGSYMQGNKAIHLKIEKQGNISFMANLPSMLYLKTTHLEGFSSSVTSEHCIETLVSAHYEFLNCKSENSTLVPVKNASTLVECSWSRTNSVLEPLPPDCITTAKIKAVAGDEETGVFLKYKEIKLLRALQLSLKTGSMTWMNSDSPSLVETEMQVLVNEERNRINKEEYSKLLELDLEHLENVIVSERIPLVFPDKLWLVLKNCSSFEQLTEAIKFIYKAFTEVFWTAPTTSINDVSTISKDINNIFDKSIRCPNLNPKKAAELLLEIGIEKMRRDYYEFFIKLGLVPQELFNQFTKQNLLSDEAVTCLEKLHSVLELLLICIKLLNLPKEMLSNFARNSLKHYTSVPKVDLQHVFTMHIPIIYIRSVLDQMRPTVWEISFFSSDENVKKQSNHRFETTAAHNNIYAPKDYHPKLMLKGASYSFSTGTLIENTLPYVV